MKISADLVNILTGRKRLPEDYEYKNVVSGNLISLPDVFAIILNKSHFPESLNRAWKCFPTAEEKSYFSKMKNCYFL